MLGLERGVWFVYVTWIIFSIGKQPPCSGMKFLGRWVCLPRFRALSQWFLRFFRVSVKVRILAQVLFLFGMQQSKLFGRYVIQLFFYQKRLSLLVYLKIGFMLKLQWNFFSLGWDRGALSGQLSSFVFVVVLTCFQLILFYEISCFLIQDFMRCGWVVFLLVVVLFNASLLTSANFLFFLVLYWETESPAIGKNAAFTQSKQFQSLNLNCIVKKQINFCYTL